MLRCQTNGDHDALQIFHHVVIGEAENAVSAGSEPSVAPLVVADTLLKIMALAIDLNDELASVGDEVGDVIAHRALPAKSQSGETVRFQMPPLQGFGAGHRAP